MNDISTTMDTYRSFVSKHAYYVIALCVASIGFSVSQTMDSRMSASLIPLGAAVALFSVSILFGFGLIRCMTKGLALDIILKKIAAGQDMLAGRDPYIMKEMYDKEAKNYTKLSNQATRNLNGQKWCFYLGVLTFIGWRVYEMYLLSLISAP